jgi:hypothetical protein
MNQVIDRQPVVNLGAIICACQMRISEAYAAKGDAYAFDALACSSIILWGFIEAGSLKRDVLNHLDETATNLGLRKRLGDAAVNVALDAGAMLYDALEDAMHGRQPEAPVPPAHALASKIYGEFNRKMLPGGEIDIAMSGRPVRKAVAA